MNIILVDTNVKLAADWIRFCGPFKEVSIATSSIEEVLADYYVSPANSFGFMDGGIYKVYKRMFGADIQEQVQKDIRDRYDGELLVGQAHCVGCLVVAPTMRIPMILPRDTVNPYLATLAALRAADRCILGSGSERTIAIPGMGTGVGRVPPQICARQMGRAIDEFLSGPPQYRDWRHAQESHQLLYNTPGQLRDLQYPPEAYGRSI